MKKSSIKIRKIHRPWNRLNRSRGIALQDLFCNLLESPFIRYALESELLLKFIFNDLLRAPLGVAALFLWNLVFLKI